jgi:transcriptional regulator with XRE-family HTH domain
MTQLDVAEKAGIDIKTISRIERGEISPTARTLEKILSVLLAEKARLGHPINKISIIFQTHEQ